MYHRFSEVTTCRRVLNLLRDIGKDLFASFYPTSFLFEPQCFWGNTSTFFLTQIVVLAVRLLVISYHECMLGNETCQSAQNRLNSPISYRHIQELLRAAHRLVHKSPSAKGDAYTH